VVQPMQRFIRLDFSRMQEARGGGRETFPRALRVADQNPTRVEIVPDEVYDACQGLNRPYRTV